MNKQEIFDTVSVHLLRQKKRSLRETEYSTECAYRGKDGLTCAAGVLIKDEHYRPELEGNTPHDWDVQHAIGKSIGRSLDKEDIELLTELQDVHDFSVISEWAEALEYIADRYDFLLSPELMKEIP